MKTKKEEQTSSRTTAGAAASTPTPTPSATDTEESVRGTPAAAADTEESVRGTPTAAETLYPQATMPARPPKGPRRVRGTLIIKADDDMEFRADRQTGLSSQVEIAHEGQSKFYKTVGDKKQSMVMHLVAPAECTDPRDYFCGQVEQLTDGMATKARPKLRGVTLLDEDDLRVVFCRKERTIEATLRIELEKTPAYTNRLITLMQRVSQCFAINQTTFRKPGK